MPELTPKLGIKKPLGNETVSRAAFNENWDIIDANAQKNIIQSNTAPASPVLGDLWIDTSTTPNSLKKYNGTVWDIVGAVTPEQIGAVKNAGNVTSIQSGLDADKPVADTVGRIYIATDTQIIYRDTGTAWQKMGVVKWGDIDGKPDLALASDLATHSADILHVPYAVATGSANAYSVTISGITNYKEGLAIAVKINTDNTGASTINVNSLGTQSIKKPNGNNVVAGNLKANSIYTLRYNGTNFILQGSDSAGNATAADVLAGKTFSNDSNTNITGTMTNNGAVIITPSTANQAIPAGYHNGSGYVKGDANLVAANIVAGRSIFGISGPTSQIAHSTASANLTGTTQINLGFRPRYVLCRNDYYSNHPLMFVNDLNPSQNFNNASGFSITINDTGFSITGPGGSTNVFNFEYVAFT